MRHRRLVRLFVGVMLLLPALALDGSAAPVPGQWRLLLKAPGIVDVAGPRADGRYVLSTQKGLLLFRPGGAAHPFANGAGGYRAGGGEPYLDLASGARVGASGCSFQRGDLFVLDAGSKPGIARVTPSGKASRFLDFAPGGFPSGIAFDRVGRFGHRLLVTVTMPNKTTTLYGVDCVAHASVIAKDAKRVEGGIVVAPTTFGAFGGRLIAADENSGGIYAFDRDGSVTLVVKPRLPSGADIGIESLGFVPPHVGPRAAVYFADLGAPKSPTHGHDSLLVLGGKDLARASVRPGELLAAMEGGGVTVAIRCRATCTVRHAARGLPGTHGEGHLTFRVT